MANDLPLTAEGRRLLLAGMALQGILHKGVNIGEENAVRQQVATAVRYADALIAELQATTSR
jgi:hypothetical protein